MFDESKKNKELEYFHFDTAGAGPYHTAPMSGALPSFLDLNGVGDDTPVTIAGRLELEQLPRLRKLTRPGGYADVRVQATSVQGRRLVTGQIRAEVTLTCQRCLGAMQYPVTADLRLIWTRTSDAAERVSEDYDPLVSASGRVRVASLVEDELLLALPMVARHAASSECAAKFPASGAQRAASVSGTGPFAVLAALKRH